MGNHEERERRKMRQIKEGNYHRPPDGNFIWYGITEEEYKRRRGEK